MNKDPKNQKSGADWRTWSGYVTGYNSNSSFFPIIFLETFRKTETLQACCTTVVVSSKHPGQGFEPHTDLRCLGPKIRIPC